MTLQNYYIFSKRGEGSRLFLQALAENYDKLEEAGIKVTITLSSDAILDTGEDEEGVEFVELSPDEKVMAALQSLAPFLMVLYDVRSDGEVTEYRNVKAYFHDCDAVRVECPFCNTEGEYVACVAPYAYPRECECGASVSVEVGDSRDVLESIHIHEDEESYTVESMDDREVRVNLRDGGRIVAVRVDEEDGEEEPDPIGTWLVFRR